MVYKIMENEDFFKENIFYSVTGRVFAILLAIFSSCFLFVSLIFPSFKDTESDYDGCADGYYYTYTEDGSGVVLRECRERDGGIIKLPSYIRGKIVVGLRLRCNYDAEITSVIIPETVLRLEYIDINIRGDSFRNLIIPSSVEYVQRLMLDYYPRTIYVEKGAKTANWDKDWSRGNDEIEEGGIYPRYHHVVYIQDYGMTDNGLLWVELENGEISIVSVESGVSNISIPNMVNGKKVTSIAPFAFYNQGEVNSISIPDSVKSIGEYVFEGCSFSTRVKENLKYAGDKANPYMYLHGANTYYYADTDGDGVETYFPNTSAIIDEKCKIIGEEAFKNWDKLTTVIIPKSVIYISNYIFAGCDSLYSIKYNGTISEWENVNKEADWYKKSYSELFPDNIKTVICSDGEITITD